MKQVLQKSSTFVYLNYVCVRLKVVENLRSSEYIDKIRSKINDFQTYSSSFYGAQPVKDDHGTAHISILANGDAVSLTSTINL